MAEPVDRGRFLVEQFAEVSGVLHRDFDEISGTVVFVYQQRDSGIVGKSELLSLVVGDAVLVYDVETARDASHVDEVVTQVAAAGRFYGF